MRNLCLVLCLLLLVGVCGAKTPTTVMEPFDYKGVTLDGGRLKAQYDEVRQDYLAIPNDDLLKVFRQRAGQPAPGADMGGWYEKASFNPFGQYLGGLARYYAGSGDTACRDKATVLIHEWAQCIEPDGFFFHSRKANTLHYDYEKMMGGLLDNYVYCGNQEALDCASRITDWAIKNLDRKHWGWNGEWYTLGENLSRAYLVTGDAKYRDFAQLWEYTEYWDLYAKKQDLFSAPPMPNCTDVSYHAYSHINSLNSAAAAYLVKGDEHYLDVITNAFDYIDSTLTLTTGAYGPMEMLTPRKGMADWMDFPWLYKAFETQCGSWAALKLSKYLVSSTGDGKYGEWVERLVYNGIGASCSARNGRVMYESDYHTGGARKRNTEDPWTCCSGTRPQAIADYVDQIYFHDEKNLAVNLFVPSTIRWLRGESTVTLQQQTRFPEEDATEFVVSTARPERFGLRIRAPKWLAGAPTATLNGEPVKLRMLDNHWAAVSRKWRDGDRLRVVLPMGFHIERADPQREYPAAVFYGPVALAIGSKGTSPANRIDLKNVEKSLAPVKGKPLHFRLTAAPELEARPFYEFKERERYFLYLDPKWSDRFSPRDAHYKGKWNWGGSSTPGDTAEYTFEGTGIRWLGGKSLVSGRAEVSIDGKVVGVGDQYGPGIGQPFSWEYQGLPAGKHTLRIRILPEKNPASRGTTIGVGGFQVR